MKNTILNRMKLVGRLLLFLLITPSLYSQTFYEDLEQAAQTHNMVGMSVIVLCDGEVADQFYYGLSDITRNLPVTDSTHYRIASISKTITATALMKLYDDGLFDLDDDISDYLGYTLRNPNFPDTPITFRMVLSHQSSLQDGTGYNDFLSATYSANPMPGITEVLLPDGDYYTSNMWRLEIPGIHFAYSNINFGLAATLVERISNNRFDLFIRQEILEPMGISGGFHPSEVDNIDNLAVLYRNAVPQNDNYQGTPPSPPILLNYMPGHNGSFFSPQGGLRVSPLDLAKFAAMHINHGSYNGIQLIDSTTVALMHQPEWTYNGSNGDNYFNLFNSWGLGFQQITNQPDGDVVMGNATFSGHPGEAYGLISDMYFNRETGFGLIFMTNGYYGTQGYSFGNNSAFYTAEESVFEAIETHWFDNCDMATSTLDPTRFTPSVFPAPFRGILNIQLPPDAMDATATLVDPLGRLVQEFRLAPGVNQLNTDGVNPGIFVLEIRTKDHSFSQIIQKH